MKGRRAVVTGGGRGIGAAIAEEFARAGARVMVAARSAEQIELVAARLAALGAEAHAFACDVGAEAGVRALGRAARERLGGVDVLVNNAGDAVASALADITLEEWNRVMTVNVTGTFLCTREFAPAMLEQGFGRVVNVASIAGLVGAKQVAHYTAAKHAVVGFTRAAAAEFAGTGVTVNAICPGYADTQMTERNVGRLRERTGRSAEDSLAAMLKSAGQRRLVTPAEIAQRVLALCTSNDNGSAVVLAGGAENDLPFEVVNPAVLGEPHGWNNGLVAPAGARLLFVAGQAGWDSVAAGSAPGFAEQFARALDKVLEVVRAAGGRERDIARLTVFVTDLPAYRADRRRLAPLWRERFGTYYPAMALVEVRGLVDPGAQVEIEATAVLGGDR